MTTKQKKERLSAEELQRLASDYRDLALRIKELEAEQKPLKDAIVAECKALGIQEAFDLGAVLVVPTTRCTQSLDINFVTPDWLYRFQEKGGVFSMKLDDVQYVPKEILDEVSFSRKESQVLTLKIQA